MKKFHDCGKSSVTVKTSLTVEKYNGCGKFTFMTTENIIGPIILKENASETIKTYILSVELKLTILCDR